MSGLANTSFDRFARYRYLLELRSSGLPAAPLRILDVGDPYGTLNALLPDDHTVSIDLFRDGSPSNEYHHHVLGSGLGLPFADQSFDVVASHDVLEHLPAGTITSFVTELLRVSRGPVVVVAPFSDPRTVECEAIVNAYYRARVGHGLEPLDEHLGDGGLPNLDELTAWLDVGGLTSYTYSGGWLQHWLVMMLLKSHFASTGDITSDREFDTAFNRRLLKRDDRPPHYRCAVLIRPPEGLEAPAQLVSDDPAAIERYRLGLADLAWRLTGALRAGEDPANSNSAFRQLVEGELAASSALIPLSDSMELLLDEVDQARAAINGLRKPQPSVAVIVVPFGGEAETRVAAALLAPQVANLDDGQLVFVVGSEDEVVADVAAEPSTRFVIAPFDDFVLRFNTALDDLDSECLLLLAPGLVPDPDFLTDMLRCYQPETGAVCVAGRIVDAGFSPMLAEIHADDDEVLFAPREAMLIQRAVYQGVGGFDGSLRRNLDDVELGWKLRIRGFRVAQAKATCRWEVSPPPWDASRWHDEAIAVLRILFTCASEDHLWSLLAPELRYVGSHQGQPGTSRSGIPWPPLFGPEDDWRTAVEQRRQLQSMRSVEDAAIIGRFGCPSAAGPPAGLSLTLDKGPSAPPDGINRRMVALIGGSPSLMGAQTLLASWPGIDLVDSSVATGLVIADANAATDLAASRAHPRKILIAPHDGTGELQLRELLEADALLCATDAQGLYWSAQLPSHWHGPPAILTMSLPLLASEDNSYGRSGIGSAGQSFVVVDATGATDASWIVDLIAAYHSTPSEAKLPVTLLGWTQPTAVDGVSLTEDRSCLQVARLVLRPLTLNPPSALGSPAPTLDAVARRVPVVSTPGDPAAGVLVAHDAGIVVTDPVSMAKAAYVLLDQPVAWARYEAGTERASAAIRQDVDTRLRSLVFSLLAEQVPAALGG